MCVCVCIQGIQIQSRANASCYIRLHSIKNRVTTYYKYLSSRPHHNGMKSPTNWHYTYLLLFFSTLMLSGVIPTYFLFDMEMDKRKWNSRSLLLVFISTWPHTAYCNKAMTPNGCEWDFAVLHFWLGMLMVPSLYFIVIWETVLPTTTLYERVCTMYYLAICRMISLFFFLLFSLILVQLFAWLLPGI